MEPSFRIIRLNQVYIEVFISFSNHFNYHRADNHLILVKNTLFKGKIFARSELEIKLYFKTWKENVEEKGYLDPAFYAEARKKPLAVMSVED